MTPDEARARAVRIWRLGGSNADVWYGASVPHPSLPEDMIQHGVSLSPADFDALLARVAAVEAVSVEVEKADAALNAAIYEDQVEVTERVHDALGTLHKAVLALRRKGEA